LETQQLLIALEGGGTRSQAALMTMDGQVLKLVESGEVNTNFTSYAMAQQSVVNAVENVLNGAGVRGEQVSHFVSALVGPYFGPETFGSLVPNARYYYYTERDVVFARAGVYRPHGLGVVAATGATVFGVRQDDGRRLSLGGWGALLGDEGSAYHLGLLGLRAAVKAFEGREEPTRLLQGICNHFGLRMDRFQSEIIALAYGKPLSRAEIAGLASLVTRLAEEGDAVAIRLTAQVADDLATLMLHAARRLFTREEAFGVVVAGGMVNSGELLLGCLRSRLEKEFPLAHLQVGTEAPAIALGRLGLLNLQ